MKSIILLAPPAAGKGTQSFLIKEKYNMPHISTGDLLRNVDINTELGKKINDLMNQGKLVDDKLILDLLEQRLSNSDCNDGYILDGFPRNINQAKSYEDMLLKLGKDLGVVIFLDLDKEIAKQRIVGRISCPSCGAVYNELMEESFPKEKGICDSCKISLVKRSDDNEESFNKRYDTYYTETEPLINYYQDKNVLYKIDSSIGKDNVFKEIQKILGENND